MSALRLSKFDGPPYAYAGRCADCGTTLRAHASDTPQRAEREMRYCAIGAVDAAASAAEDAGRQGAALALARAHDPGARYGVDEHRLRLAVGRQIRARRGHTAPGDRQSAATGTGPAGNPRIADRGGDPRGGSGRLLRRVRGRVRLRGLSAGAAAWGRRIGVSAGGRFRAAPRAPGFWQDVGAAAQQARG